ncbi:MAG: hypothetical protein AVDCRST_MAG56-2673 [uncultured Cytophagales bacterium]|uniref:Uncharacterized protein n=1 Tax=uncultured Cytophagales bacterium TaxID=158755 RepID=A0A6J4IWK2_9SPHI|nr:MAG: hypothetical protein AVDCRST_MAG56-2673 [uncultured Cytophagales bacterium]
MGTPPPVSFPPVSFRSVSFCSGVYLPVGIFLSGPKYFFSASLTESFIACLRPMQFYPRNHSQKPDLAFEVKRGWVTRLKDGFAQK